MRATPKFWLTTLTLCVAALLMVGVRAAGDADKAKAKAKAKARTQTAVKAAAKVAETGPANPLRWKFSKDAKRTYELTQTVTATTSLPGAPKQEPIEVKGKLEMTGLEDGKAQLFLRAEKQGASAVAVASPPTPAAPKAEPSSSCSCRRAGPAAPAKPATPPPPPRPTGPQRMQALFTLSADGTLEGSSATAGGQTELMTKLLLPLPGKLLKVGEEEESEMVMDAVGSRFPLLGTKKTSYAELREVEGRQHALIKSKVALKGKGDAQPPAKDQHGLERPAKTMEGTMELKADTEGLFDLEGGFYRSVNSRLWLQINTSRMSQGTKQDVTLEQTQESRLTLKAPEPAKP